jgi:hypothetical protein
MCWSTSFGRQAMMKRSLSLGMRTPCRSSSIASAEDTYPRFATPNLTGSQLRYGNVTE